MSINFTSDIDGATSGSGITKITVGGKTINLSETGSTGSGNGVASGSFTPEAQEESISIDTGVDFTHIFVGKKTKTLNYGYRTFVGIFADIDNNFLYFVGTNSAGTAFSGAMQYWEDQSFYVKNGTVFSAALDTASSSGVCCPEEYIWYAW